MRLLASALLVAAVVVASLGGGCSTFGQDITVTVIEPEPQITVEVLAAAEDTRQKLYATCAPFYCPPCELLKTDHANGLLDDFNVEFIDDPGWEGTYPVIRWHDGERWCYLVHPETKENLGYSPEVLQQLKEKILGHPPAVAKQPAPKLLSPPVRYIKWPGWSQDIDLETYNRNCNCGMCVRIRQLQEQYWKDKKAYEAQQKAPQYTKAAIESSQAATPLSIVNRMVNHLGLDETAYLADPGCGDARILIQASRSYSCRCIGIEIDPLIAAVAKENVKKAGLDELIEIREGDALTFDYIAEGVTHMTAHLYDDQVAQLLPQMKQMKAVATPYHEVPGLGMVKEHGVWLYRG